MSIIDADITISEIDNHIGEWCDSGHKAPLLFRRNGPTSPELPIRFFSITSKNFSGIFCEACLIIARALKK
jgi:hypothetical protein